jgi:hypothetical protein
MAAENSAYRLVIWKTGEKFEVIICPIHPGLLVERLICLTVNPRRVSAWGQSRPGHIQSCEYKEGLSDETKTMVSCTRVPLPGQGTSCNLFPSFSIFDEKISTFQYFGKWSSVDYRKWNYWRKAWLAFTTTFKMTDRVGSHVCVVYYSNLQAQQSTEKIMGNSHNVAWHQCVQVSEDHSLWCSVCSSPRCIQILAVIFLGVRSNIWKWKNSNWTG